MLKGKNQGFYLCKQKKTEQSYTTSVVDCERREGECERAEGNCDRAGAKCGSDGAKCERGVVECERNGRDANDPKVIVAVPEENASEA